MTSIPAMPFGGAGRIGQEREEGSHLWQSPKILTGPPIRAGTGVAEQTRTDLASGGAQGHESNGLDTLILVTTGRLSGEPRRTCLIYGTRGSDFVVVASKGGDSDDPDWLKNLQIEPTVGVQVGARRFTAREIPVVLLTPHASRTSTAVGTSLGDR